MIPAFCFFLAGVCVGFAWGWFTGREDPNGPQRRF
jgi:hypothetical protein